jgi:hypothetical protein
MTDSLIFYDGKEEYLIVVTNPVPRDPRLGGRQQNVKIYKKIHQGVVILK